MGFCGSLCGNGHKRQGMKAYDRSCKASSGHGMISVELVVLSE